MSFRLMSWLFLASVFLLGGLNSNSVFSQSDADIEKRIEQGKKFMAGPRVDEWKKYLKEVPNLCRKMSLVSDGKRHSDYFFIKDHSLVVMYSSDGNSTLNLRNPKYLASIRKQSEKVRLETFSSGIFSPYSSPLSDLSTAPGAHLLWVALKGGLIEVADFRTENDSNASSKSITRYARRA